MMAERPQDMTREFHTLFGLFASERPTVPPTHVRRGRARLIGEEAAELVAELLAGLPYQELSAAYNEIVLLFRDRARPPAGQFSLARMAKESGDLQVAVAGGAVEGGFDLDEATAAVHAANMTKADPDGPTWDEHGKVLKGAGYRPADLSGVVGR